jgi:hypothetical protein
LIVDLLKLRPQRGICHLTDEILASHRSEQPGVRRLLHGEVVNGQPGGNSSVDGAAARGQGIEKTVLRPADSAQPHRRQ